MFSDMGSVTAIIYKAHPTLLLAPLFRNQTPSERERGHERAETQLAALQEQEIINNKKKNGWGKKEGDGDSHFSLIPWLAFNPLVHFSFY